MKNTIAIILSCAAVLSARAERSAAYSIDAFNSACQTNGISNRVFSPFSYELDCCVFAEASDPVQRANIAETYGVLTDFESVYRPIVDEFASVTNPAAPVFLAARALCLRDVDMAKIGFRKTIWDLCNASVCPLLLMDGAETWFRAKMDGYMEDLEFPPASSVDGRYCYYDVVYASSCLVCENKPSAVARDFIAADGSRRQTHFVKARTPVEYYTTSKYALYRFPLLGGDWLYVATVPEKGDFSSLAKALNCDNFRSTLAMMSAVGDPNCKKGVCSLVMPGLKLHTETDLKSAMAANKIPASGFANLDSSLVKRDARQIVRFNLKYEETANAAAALADEDESATALPDLGEIVFDRPFLFFVLHPAKDLITIAGEFVK